MSLYAEKSESIADAADLLDEGISRVMNGDPSAVTCLSVAEVLYETAGDCWKAGIARQWHGFGLALAKS